MKKGLAILFCMPYTLFVALFLFTMASCSKEDGGTNEDYYTEEPNNGNGNSNNGNSGKNNNDNNKPNNNNSGKTFYVKYEMNVDFSRNDKAFYLKINYVTDTGIMTLLKDLTRKRRFSWDGTYGPFKEGQTVSIDCNADIGNYPSNMYKGVGDYSGRIMVKEGNGDYSVKAEGTSSSTSGSGLIYSTGLHLTYTLK